MPVLVTAAHTPLGQLVVARVLRAGGQVRAYCSGAADVGALRAAGAIVASGHPLDEGHLEAAMAQVHTVVHVTRGPLAASPEIEIEEGATVVTAAIGAGVQRLLLLSLPGATAGATDPVRRSLAEVEELFAEAPTPSVVLRPGLVDTSELRDAVASLPLGPRLLDTPVAPVRAADVAEAIGFLDELRSTAHEGHVVLSAPGPEPLTLAAYLEQVGIGAPGRVGRLVGRVWRGAGAYPCLEDVLAGPWMDPAWPAVWDLADLAPRRLTA